MHEEKCLEKHTVYQGPSFSVRQDRVELKGEPPGGDLPS